MQDSYEQQGSSFGINLGFGLKKPALNNASISMGIVDIYKETTKRSTGIIELATNDNNISEAESLILKIYYRYPNSSVEKERIFKIKLKKNKEIA